VQTGKYQPEAKRQNTEGI